MSTDQTEQRARRAMTDRKALPAIPANIDIPKAKLLSVHPDQEPRSAASSIRSGVSSGSSSLHSGAEGGEPYMGPHGWVLPSHCRHRSVSRSSMASRTSFRTDETPLTPMSNPSDALDVDLSGMPEASNPEIKQEDTEPRPLFAIPLRPKHKSNQESWDSALGSDIGGQRRGHVPSASLSTTSDYCSIRSLSLDERSPPPVAKPLMIPGPRQLRGTTPKVTPADGNAYSSVEESDSDETVSDETVSGETIPPKDASARVLNYTLDVVFGLPIDNVTTVPTTCRSIVDNFMSDMAWAVDKDLLQKQAIGYTCAADLSRLPTNASTSSSSATGSSQRSSTRSDKGKRKSRGAGDDDQDGDDECDKERTKRRDSGPSKRPKLDSLRMSCPYRKKNPLRFNVRDYRLCALTVFTDTAELRRHIQDVHKRPALPHHCPRCQSQFPTQDKFDDHLRSDDICPLVERPLGSQDPEDGIDEAVVKTLRSKKGRVSDPVEVQWQKIWELLFPGTPVQPYEYCAVMEHFELHEKYRSSLPRLRASLSSIGLGERGLDSLSKILDNHFIGLFEQCNDEGRQKDYRNRQPKPQQSQLRPKRRSFRERVANKAHRDSGVDVGMEDDEAVEQTVMAKLSGPEDNTPSFGMETMETNDMLVGSLGQPHEDVDYPGFDNFQGLEHTVFDGDYRDMAFPTEPDATALADQYCSRYAADPSGHNEFGTKHAAGIGMLPGHNVEFQSQPQLDVHWGVGSTVLGLGEPMADLDAWIYTQQDPRR